MTKKRLVVITVLSALFFAGCSSVQSCDTENELLCDLYQTGVTEAKTRRMVFEGSDSNFGPIRVEVDNDTINEVWSMLHGSEPGGRFAACGWVTIEFYNSRYSVKPNARLEIFCGGNDSGMHVKETNRAIYDKKAMSYVGLYKCAGLEEYVLKILEKEYKKHNQQ